MFSVFSGVKESPNVKITFSSDRAKFLDTNVNSWDNRDKEHGLIINDQVFDLTKFSDNYILHLLCHEIIETGVMDQNNYNKSNYSLYETLYHKKAFLNDIKCVSSISNFSILTDYDGNETRKIVEMPSDFQEFMKEPERAFSEFYPFLNSNLEKCFQIRYKMSTNLEVFNDVEFLYYERDNNWEIKAKY